MCWILSIVYLTHYAGVQRFPIDKWALAVVDVIKKTSKTKTSIEEIHFVDTKTGLLKHLKTALSLAFPRSAQEILPPQMSHGTLSKSPSSMESSANEDHTNQMSRLASGKELGYSRPVVLAISSSCMLVIDKKNILGFCGDAIGVTDDTCMFGLGRLSQDIASAAGESYNKEKLSKKKDVNVGDIIVTKAGNLQCEHILHGICDISRGNRKHDFSSLVRNMLSRACHLKVKTLALPAISTGR